MVEKQMAGRRPRGRPQLRSDEETRRLLVAAASQEFVASGYAGTSMGAVAQRAGVSTKTIYRLVATKEELFAMAVTDRIDRFERVADAVALLHLGLEDALVRVLIEYGSLTLDAEVIAFTRLVIAECDRFPEIADSFYRRAIERTNGLIVGWLRSQCERGLIELDDIQAASGMLRGMMVMEPQRAVMLRQMEAPSAEDIARRARACARLFLSSCRVSPSEARQRQPESLDV